MTWTESSALKLPDITDSFATLRMDPGSESISAYTVGRILVISNNNPTNFKSNRPASASKVWSILQGAKCRATTPNVRISPTPIAKESLNSLAGGSGRAGLEDAAGLAGGA